MAVGNDVQWQRFCEAIARPDLAADPRYAAVTGRVTGRAELIPELGRTMLGRPANISWRIDRAVVPRLASIRANGSNSGSGPKELAAQGERPAPQIESGRSWS